MSNNFLRCRDPWKAGIHRRSKGEPRAIIRSRSRAAACVSIRTHARARGRQAQPGWSLLTFWKFRNRNGSSRRAFDARFATGVPAARRRFHRWPLERFLMLFRKNNLALRWKGPNLNHFSFFEIINREVCKPNRWEKSKTYGILLKILFPCYYVNFRDI